MRTATALPPSMKAWPKWPRLIPHAWNRDGMKAEQIRNASPKNKMLAFPYTKYHNSQWNVDQAGALLFCSVAKAEALGIPRD